MERTEKKVRRYDLLGKHPIRSPQVGKKRQVRKLLKPFRSIRILNKVRVVDKRTDHAKPLSIRFFFFFTTISTSNKTILSVCDQDRDKLTAALSVLLSTTDIGKSDYAIIAAKFTFEHRLPD